MTPEQAHERLRADLQHFARRVAAALRHLGRVAHKLGHALHVATGRDSAEVTTRRADRAHCTVCRPHGPPRHRRTS